MIPEEDLMSVLKEDFFLENILAEFREGKNQKFLEETVYHSSSPLTNWFLRSGILPESHLTQNRIGLYTDFT